MYFIFHMLVFMIQKLTFPLFLITYVLSSSVQAEDYTLRLIHTNDLHAHIIPYETSGETCNINSKNCRGGFARIKTFIDKERQKDPNLILLDGGDRFSGTVFYTLRKGKDIAALMQEMKYDAMTLGNHDFDDGLPEIEAFMKTVTAPILASNVSFPSTSPLNKTVLPALVLHRKGKQIGLISVVTTETKTTSSHAEEIDVLSPIEYILPLIEKLKKQGVNIIILLNHNGLAEDKKLAAQLPDIDIIVNAHSHSLLSNNPSELHTEGPYPLVIQNPQGKPVLIVSAGIGGHHVGALSVYFDEHGDILSFTGDTVAMDEKIQPDKYMNAQIEKIQQDLKEILTRPVLKAEYPMPLTNGNAFCSQSCYAGEILTDALLLAAQEFDSNINIALINGGGIRSGLPGGLITFQNIAQAYPFDSQAVLVTLSGKELIDYLTQGIQEYLPDDRTNPFIHVAGASYDFSAKEKKVMNVQVNHKPIDLNKTYTVVIPSFLAKGGDGFPPLKVLRPIPHTTIRKLIIKQLSNSANKINPFENRIQKKE